MDSRIAKRVAGRKMDSSDKTDGQGDNYGNDQTVSGAAEKRGAGSI